MRIRRRACRIALLLFAGLALLLLPGAALYAQCFTGLPDPIITLGGTENYLNFEGTPYVRYRIPVVNWSAFPDALFVPRPDLPACGINTDAARGWVEIYDASDDSYIYGFCAFDSANDLTNVWFGLLPGVTPPAQVYIKIIDRDPACTDEWVSAPINVYAPTPAVANPDAFNTPEDTAYTGAVLSNDTDINGDTLDVTAVTAPSHGTATLLASNSVRYTPAANYHGSDSFTYTVSDGTHTTVGTVNVTVSSVPDNPVAAADAATVAEDSSVSVSVLANDTDVDIPLDGDVLAVQSVTDPPHGTTSIVGLQVLYTPDANYNGSDSFSYTMNDGTGRTDSANVSVTVTSVPDAPNAPTGLQTQGKVDPINVSDYTPLFSWLFSDIDEADASGDHQSAWQIRIGTSSGASDAWDSGKVTGVPGSGTLPGAVVLLPNATYWWSVRVWDSYDLPSAYATDGTFVILDIGLRVFDGTQIVRIATDYVSPTTYPLRIHKGGTTYGIVLVDPSDPDASKIRIQTSSGIKALKKM